MRVLLVLLTVCASGLLSQQLHYCTSTERARFIESWKNGYVEWAAPLNVTSLPGTLRCNEGYVFQGKSDLVYCYKMKYMPATKNATCLSEDKLDSTQVKFHNQTYMYEYIKVGKKTRTFPVLHPNISYVLTTDYMASKQTPTIRVRVGLIGKANRPVLVNIQQSTESVGFELPMKVVGKGSQELAPLYEHTVDLCPVTLKLDDKNNSIPIKETVNIFLTGGGIIANHSTPKVQVHPSQIQQLQLSPGAVLGPNNIDDRESEMYRYNWPTDGSVDEVDILVTYSRLDSGGNKGKGPDVCAKMSLRSGTCPMEDMGISELTFTRQAFITVSKNDERLKHIKDGFLIVVDVFPDDYRCRSTPGATESQSRTKAIKIVLNARTKLPPFMYIAVPVVTCIILLFLTGAVLLLFIKPLFVKLYDDGTDESIIDPNDTTVLVKSDASESLPPFDQKEEAPPKMVDMEDGEVPEGDGEEEDSEAGSRDDLTGNGLADDILDQLLRPDSFSIGTMFDKVRKNQLIVNLTQTIGHCSIPLLVFLNSFDSTFVDIQGNLKAHTLDGNLDSCYVNSRCAFPANISGYRIPDVSRVMSNIPYVVSGACFYFLALQKNKIMAPINKLGKGVKHDFAIFYAIAFITAIIGVASAMYHVCPNQTTSRIDMYFIEILLGYYSLKLYQSRVPDIREVYYAPAIIICVLSAIERVLGGSSLSWDMIAAVHFFFTLWISVQLFFMGKVTMNPFAMARERKTILKKIKENKSKPEFKYQGGFFLIGIVATLIIAATAAGGMWNEQAMYNVFALSTDIVIYLMYYVVTKCILRQEKIKTHVVVAIAASCITWIVSFIFFFGFKSINTSVSPAESRALNKPCIAGFLDGHDLWHCLSATAIFLTNVMILLIDDDLIDTKTEDTYF